MCRVRCEKRPSREGRGAVGDGGGGGGSGGGEVAALRDFCRCGDDGNGGGGGGDCGSGLSASGEQPGPQRQKIMVIPSPRVTQRVKIFLRSRDHESFC